jgi:DNA-binding transcriptional regulator YiaG
MNKPVKKPKPRPLGELIKLLRQAKGWSQERLARELEVSHITVYRWERGTSIPSNLARKYLDVLFAEEEIEVEKR